MAEKSPNFGTFNRIGLSDEVVYVSHEPPKGIVGMFAIKSGRGEKIIDRNDEPLYYYDIAPLLLANKGLKPRKVVMKNVVGHHLKPMGIVFELKPLEYEKIKSFLLRMERAKSW
jgi:hypothetical protein